MNTFDLTPNWETAVAIYVEVLTHGNGGQQDIARDELMRLARYADFVDNGDEEYIPSPDPRQMSIEFKELSETFPCPKIDYPTQATLHQE